MVPPEEYLAETREYWQRDCERGVELVCSQAFAYLKDWWKACNAAGIRMRPCDIRHPAASEMLAGGAGLASAAAQLGHAPVMTTGRMHAHVLAGGQARGRGWKDGRTAEALARAASAR